MAGTKALRRSVQMIIFRAKSKGYRLDVVADALKDDGTLNTMIAKWEVSSQW